MKFNEVYHELVCLIESLEKDYDNLVKRQLELYTKSPTEYKEKLIDIYFRVVKIFTKYENVSYNAQTRSDYDILDTVTNNLMQRLKRMNDSICAATNSTSNIPNVSIIDKNIIRRGIVDQEFERINAYKVSLIKDIKHKLSTSEQAIFIKFFDILVNRIAKEECVEL